MKNLSAVYSFSIVAFLMMVVSCKNNKFMIPEISLTDKQLFDSCNNAANLVYYKNNSSTVHSGANGPHGPFKLKFNKIASLVLTDNGKLPVGQTFPDGSLIVKEIQPAGIFAFMYKFKKSWLWGEAEANGSTIFSINKDPISSCVNCHSQSGERDLVVSFNFY